MASGKTLREGESESYLQSMGKMVLEVLLGLFWPLQNMYVTECA